MVSASITVRVDFEYLAPVSATHALYALTWWVKGQRNMLAFWVLPDSFPIELESLTDGATRRRN